MSVHHRLDQNAWLEGFPNKSAPVPPSIDTRFTAEPPSSHPHGNRQVPR